MRLDRRTKRRQMIVSVVIAIFIYFGSSVVISRILSYQLWQQTTVEASRMLASANEIKDEIILSLTNLNILPFEQCSDENLLEMRKTLFRSQYIKDVGYFTNGDLVCTTGLGQLDVPFKDRTPPNFVTEDGIEYWSFEHLIFFDQEHSALIARYQNYNVVVEPTTFGHLVSEDYEWEMFFNGNNQTYTWAGQEGVADEARKEQPMSLMSPALVSVIKCNSYKRVCVAVKPKLLNRSEYPPLLFELTTLLSICFSVFAYLLVHKYFRVQWTPIKRVQRGLASNQFYCLYQPIVELKSGKIIGVEMLARFEDQYGSLTPDEFIPLISQLNKTWQFTEQVMLKAMQETVPISHSGFKLSMNIYPQDIANGNVESLLELSAFNDFPGKIMLEVTESEYLEGDGACNTLSQLQKQGVDIAIDDFGTGYSNLNQLRKINSQVLKIDRSFVIDVEDGAIRSSLIQHIVDIARAENMLLVAEGVETSVQHQALAKMGIEYAQGWAFGRPMSYEKLVRLLIEE